MLTVTKSVAFARYAVSVALQYEIDAREKPLDWNTGYFPQGSSSPTEYPSVLYGTEVFEVNEVLRQLAISFARTATLNDTADAMSYRALYASIAAYTPGSKPPSVVACDTATSDVYFSGALLGDAFENTTSLFTSGRGIYCTTQQEDNATLEVYNPPAPFFLFFLAILSWDPPEERFILSSLSLTENIILICCRLSFVPPPRISSTSPVSLSCARHRISTVPMLTKLYWMTFSMVARVFYLLLRTFISPVSRLLRVFWTDGTVNLPLVSKPLIMWEIYSVHWVANRISGQ